MKKILIAIIITLFSCNSIAGYGWNKPIEESEKRIKIQHNDDYERLIKLIRKLEIENKELEKRIRALEPPLVLRK